LFLSLVRVPAMSAKQMVLLTATVVGVVVVVTLVKVGMRGVGQQQKSQTVQAKILTNPHLTFAHAVDAGGAWAALGPPSRYSPDEKRPPNEEAMGEGTCDFWFRNEHDVPVELILMKLSCNRCLTAKVGLAAPGWQAAQAAGTVGLGPAAALGGLSSASADPVPGPDVAWEKLESEEVNKEAKGFTVPPQSGGWVRVGWKEQKAGPQLLNADFRTKSQDSAPPIRLQYGVFFVDAVRVLPEEKEKSVESLGAGDRPREVEFTLYSSTRPSFKLETESDDTQKKRHPFVTCGKPVPLTDAQCRDLQKERKEAVLCGYKVAVTVYERLPDGREHAIGPFKTAVGLKSDVMEESIRLVVTGTVRGGDITVLSPDGERDRVAFGVFKRSSGVTRTVVVETPPGTPLRVDRAPEFIQYELKQDDAPPGRRQTWTLTLTIPANAVTGSFPTPEAAATGDVAIYLMAKDRPVRIPVSGTASPG
jgi:hypothetical protein